MIKVISNPIRVVSFVLRIRWWRVTVDVLLGLIINPITIVVEDSVDVVRRL
jgi:hypothetical protein